MWLRLRNHRACVYMHVCVYRAIIFGQVSLDLCPISIHLGQILWRNFLSFFHRSCWGNDMLLSQGRDSNSSGFLSHLTPEPHYINTSCRVVEWLIKADFLFNNYLLSTTLDFLHPDGWRLESVIYQFPLYPIKRAEFQKRILFVHSIR